MSDIKTQRAESALEGYTFGDGVMVIDQGNWNTDDAQDYTKSIYVEYADDAADTPSHKLSFHVKFNDGTIDAAEIQEVYALDVATGNEIGHNPNAMVLLSRLLIIESLDGEPVTRYQDFDALYDFLDVLMHYHMQDNDEELQDYKASIKTAYDQLMREANDA